MPPLRPFGELFNKFPARFLFVFLGFEVGILTSPPNVTPPTCVRLVRSQSVDFSLTAHMVQKTILFSHLLFSWVAAQLTG